MVNLAGDRHHIDPDFINSVIHAESGFNSRALSPKGAQGLMQLMPNTATALGVTNAFDPGANVEGGTRYLRELLERYNYDVVKALAAYNAGPGRVSAWLTSHRSLPGETRNYVAIITGWTADEWASGSPPQTADPLSTCQPRPVGARPWKRHAPGRRTC